MTFDIDQAMNDINSGAFEGSQTSGEGQQLAPQINQSPYDPNLNIPYKANGKDITEPLATVVQRASMGYNYAQLMQQYKQREEAMKAQEQQIAQQSQKWREYDEYASQNPQWADHVRQSWESRFNSSVQAQNQGLDFNGTQQQSSLPPEVMSELSEMRSFVQQYRAEQQARMQAEQDATLNNEIQTIQNEFPDIDLRATDPTTGENLEQQILLHAQTNGINSFRAAFRDYMFDKLLARGTTHAKETVAKQMQQQVKQGFLGQSDTPMFGGQQGQGKLSGHSYHSLMDLAARELGLNT